MSKQEFIVGKQVQVGFLKLTVMANLPKSQSLLSNGKNIYRFEPYNGLSKITDIEAQALLAYKEEAAARESYRTLEAAARSAKISSIFA